ncbi:unnamed protein product [Protopolystoma xenopodis]|uniref:Uncharacterized protein n=1 Tax=Protopolystoma xenopodis TaxID=117903 RepID=A0A3S5AGM6_9PLAT|nr:unnamed protein product [Protopolystoma xenopodis]
MAEVFLGRLHGEEQEKEPNSSDVAVSVAVAVAVSSSISSSSSSSIDSDGVLDERDVLPMGMRVKAIDENCNKKRCDDESGDVDGVAKVTSFKSKPSSESQDVYLISSAGQSTSRRVFRPKLQRPDRPRHTNSQSSLHRSTSIASDRPPANGPISIDSFESAHCSLTLESLQDLSDANDNSMGQVRKSKRRKAKKQTKAFTIHGKPRPEVIDMKTLYSGITILTAKLKLHDLKLAATTNDAAYLKQLYKRTILEDSILRRIFSIKQIHYMPKELRTLVADHTEVSRIGHKAYVRDEQADNERFLYISMAHSANSIIADIQDEFLEVEAFTIGLYQIWMSFAIPDKNFLFQPTIVSHDQMAFSNKVGDQTTCTASSSLRLQCRKALQ